MRHPDTFSDTLSFPLFVVNRKWHSSGSAFCPPPPPPPPPLLSSPHSVFCLLFFLVCADCDELDGTVGGGGGGGGGRRAGGVTTECMRVCVLSAREVIPGISFPAERKIIRSAGSDF